MYIYIVILFAALHSFNSNLTIQTMLQQFLPVFKLVCILFLNCFKSTLLNFISSKEKEETNLKYMHNCSK